MTIENPRSTDWMEWEARDWGRALLQHYFAGHDSRPVSRLAINPEELAKAANASESEAAHVRDHFLRAVRCSPAAFRRHLSSVSLNTQSWNRHEEPPFLAYLFFTCFAAASLDADIADEGVFRERVRQLLGHDEGTSYPLDELSLLWEAFADWLQDRHDEGAPYRLLSLPDRGWMRRIGYSVRLAFPRRDDRLRLRRALDTAAVGSSPTVPEALKAIGGSREPFSSEFRQVFAKARAAVVSGVDTPELQALWSAVLEATALSGNADRRNTRIRFRLLAQQDELGRVEPFVVANGVPRVTARGIQFSPLDEPFDGFDHYLCAADGTTNLIARLLLMDALDEKIPGLSASPIHRALRDGVLLFRQLDSATWELTATRPNEGRVRALVRTHLSNAFLRLVRGEVRHRQDDRFVEWREVAPFDVTKLAEPAPHNAPELEAVRCLQRIEVGPHLHLVGGIRIEGGYLGLRELLPDVYCAAADHAALIGLSGGSGEQQFAHIVTLEARAGQPGLFGWPAERGDLEGAALLAGTRDGRVVAPREVTFHARGLSHAYRGPTHPERWLVEDSATDVRPAGLGSDLLLTREIGRPAPMPPIEGFASAGVQVFSAHAVDDDVEHDRLVEALAAIAVATTGLPESELIDIFGKLVRHATGVAVWGIVRAWVEAGYLDCLTRRHWRGRVYFARLPRLILVPDDSSASIRVVLHGLAPYRLRSAIRKVFDREGATPLQSCSLSPFVPAPSTWRFASLECASAAIAEFGELEVAGVRDPGDLAGDFDAAVSDEAPLPPGYRCERVWDWAAGRFRGPNVSASTSEVRIEYLTRSNGPDRYVVGVGDHRCATVSRSWALLAGFRRAKRTPFRGVGRWAIVRQGDDGPQIPLPIARVIGLRSGIAAGPALTPTGDPQYAYAPESPAVQRWLLRWLCGATSDDVVVRRFAWLRAATDACRTDSVPLPADIRRRLRSLETLPDATSMADRRIPRRLLAHVRRAVELAET